MKMRAVLLVSACLVAGTSAIAADMCTDVDSCAAEVELNREKYDVTFDYRWKGLPMVRNLPPEEFPNLNWTLHTFGRFGIMLGSYLEKFDGGEYNEPVPVSPEMTTEAVMSAVYDEIVDMVAKSRVDRPRLAKMLRVAVTRLEEKIGTLSSREKKVSTEADSELATLVGKVVKKLVDTALSVLVAPNGARPSTVQGYDHIFDPLVGKLDAAQIPPRDEGALQYDQVFTRWRLSGYCPFMLRKATRKLLHDMHIDHYRGPTENLVARTHKALKDGRLFASDYEPILSKLKRGKGRYIAYVVALFEIPEDEETMKREGVVVLCVQVMKGKHLSIFTPDDSEWEWKYAKLAFNSMEANYHSGFTHIAQTHLVEEAIGLSLKRSLPSNHPIRILMDPHLYATMFINWVAEMNLVSEGGPIDLTISATIESWRAAVIDMVHDTLNGNLTFPARIESYGLTEEEFPTSFYPYREFGYKFWNPIRKYVARYLNVYYKSDADVDADPQLDSFREELLANKVGWAENWTPGKGGSLGFLTDFLTSAIFIAGPQHSVVNFPQPEMLSVPNLVPQALYSPPADRPGMYTFEEDVVNALPPLRETYLIRDTMLFLAYRDKTFVDFYSNPPYENAEARAAAKDFYGELQNIEAYMKKRNKEFVAAWDGVADDLPQKHKNNWAYELLLPSMNPMSINI
ncbi:Linoleate 9/13-lipoxygenase [Diplonema papillatum]|nr:Linoleate 9/13-lipoxygenase [Diplonema papillatum]